jgi:hypothetical protein
MAISSKNPSLLLTIEIWSPYALTWIVLIPRCSVAPQIMIITDTIDTNKMIIQMMIPNVFRNRIGHSLEIFLGCEVLVGDLGQPETI